MINHRGGILIFGQILMKSKVWILTKSKIWNPLNLSRNQNFGSLTNLVLPNLDRSRSQLSQNTKIVKFGQILVHKIKILKTSHTQAHHDRSPNKAQFPWRPTKLQIARRCHGQSRLRCPRSMSHQPKTHKICDKKNFFGIKFDDFGEIWWNYTFMAKQRDVASPWRCNFVKITIHRAKQRHVASPDEL